MKNKLTLLVIAILALAASSCKKEEPAGIDFSTIEDSGLESVSSGKHVVPITLSKSLASEITIGLTYSGTAVASSDYFIAETEVTIPAGNTSANFTFATYDNDNYEGIDKTVIIEMTSISGPGLSEAKLGDNTTYTYTIEEDELQIDLEWTCTSGNVDDYDLDLYLYTEVEIDYSWFGSGIETIVMDGSYNNDTYYVIVDLYDTEDLSETADYTVKLSFPDGTTQTSTADYFTDGRTNNRTIFSITKEDGGYSAVENPNGVNGKVGSSNYLVSRK